MLPRAFLFAGVALIASNMCSAASAPVPANQDENKVPRYTLPDPLVLADGTPVRDAAAWRKRRGELLELFAQHEYGRTPGGASANMKSEAGPVDRAALGGKAVRREVTLTWQLKTPAPKLRLLIYQPAGEPPPGGWPVFLGLNFFGNHTVHADPGIALAEPHVLYDVERYRVAAAQTNAPADPEQRGVHAPKWQIERVVARGYATVTLWCHDIFPDRADVKQNVHGLFGSFDADEREDETWGAIGAWAWGLSRALDYVQRDAELDGARVAVHGFSRLGKAAVWAGAQDERFALVISNESGCGGAALHKRIYGETVALINSRFPHWFAKSFRRYNDNEAALPVDQHALLALIAPRPLYVASAEGDQWSDPRGEFLGLKGAEPVYRLLGRKGLGVDEMPAVDRPAMGDALGYHIRSGKHDTTEYDWAQFLDFADRWLKETK